MKKVYTIICVSLATLLLWSCDDILGTSEDSRYDNLPSVNCTLRLGVCNLVASNASASRASVPEEGFDSDASITEKEKKVHNLWIFQFANGGQKLLTCGYYPVLGEGELLNVPVVLKAVNENTTILVVTNTNDPNWMKGKNINTIDELKALSIGEPRPVLASDLDEDVFAIPMEGQLDDVNTTTQTDITVPVKLMYAKLNIKVKILESVDASLYNVNVTNIPWNCTLNTRSCDDGDAYSEEEKVAATYPEETPWITRSFTPTEAPSTEGDGSTAGTNKYKVYGDYVIYVPENIQGENGDASTTPNKKADNHPEQALAITTSIKKNNTTDESQFVVYPGGNRHNNFNVKRNRIYNVTVTLNSFNETTVRKPSSNCFVVEPGNLLSFEPYYRTETGGGYKYTDYVNSHVNATKISSVKILWQTKDCIGDNTDGSLVYLGPEDTNVKDPDGSGTSDLDCISKQKIYVKAQKEGNALIAAYNDNGKILWSWHIWVAKNDPGNIGNAVVYTTYAWDKNGVDASVRIPRYGIMPCNLGALCSDFPVAVEEANRCHGMLYQWGRKDPFPPITKMDDHVGAMIYDYTAEPQPSYNSMVTVMDTYYGNDNETPVGMTADADETKLFHSVTSDDIQQNAANSISPFVYAIQNPTVFMCGTKRCNPKDIYVTNDAEYVSKLDNYAWEGDWTPVHDDKLWGAKTPEKDADMNWLQVAYARIWHTSNPADSYEGFGLYIFDNYVEGKEGKTIFDPCPEGWRVSPGDLWLEFTQSGNNPKSVDDINYDAAHSASYGMSMYMRAFRQGPTSYFPCQGLRFGDGTIGRANRCGNYHNATPDLGNHVNIVHIHNDIGFFHNFEYEYYQLFVKSAGCPVRCVRETL